MCGRFTNRLKWREIHDLYSLKRISGDWKGRINIPPAVKIPIVRIVDGERVGDLARWGLVPYWAKEIKSYATHNAMLETVEEKASYRGAWAKEQRCVIPADSFFERRKIGDKQDFRIGLANGGPMAFAGLWDQATIEGEPLLSCTMITTPPDAFMEPIHHRMPISLGVEEIDRWLVHGDLRPVAPERMKAWKIGPAWGKWQNEDPSILEEA